MDNEPSEIFEEDDAIDAPLEDQDLTQVPDDELDSVATNTPYDPELEGQAGLE